MTDEPLELPYPGTAPEAPLTWDDWWTEFTRRYRRRYRELEIIDPFDGLFGEPHDEPT